ncbi:FlgO family outer membrane protein [Desulfonatronovibrio hydrogenovorans]|uniref:FlgO family outer membrane protein n=1 Tax=Desulfonatronovibrio hydrogenovorans TaxID=53245 RepID=UPI0006893751|nr:FlgO family outer membrane protein [Desulfonatronovibrio hydrogenovorans]
MNKNRIFKGLLMAMLLTLWAGHLPGLNSQAGAHALREKAYFMADMLEYNLSPGLTRLDRLSYASFVDLDQLRETSSLGRALGELFASRFAQHGYDVQDVRLIKDSLIIQEGVGELALSRDILNLTEAYQVRAVIAGTYSKYGQWMQVSARILDTGSNRILAAFDEVFPMDSDLEDLVVRTQTARPFTLREPDPVEPPVVEYPALFLNPAVGSDARVIQARLAQMGYYTGPIDGIWGPRSREALRKFRTHHGLPGEGWDMEVQKKIFRDLN